MPGRYRLALRSRDPSCFQYQTQLSVVPCLELQIGHIKKSLRGSIQSGQAVIEPCAIAPLLLLFAALVGVFTTVFVAPKEGRPRGRPVLGRACF